MHPLIFRHLVYLFLAALVSTATARGGGPPVVPPRVALAEFSTDDNLCRSAEESEKLNALVQSELLGDEAGFDWIERAQWRLAADELRLSAGGWTSSAGALRVGKWLKADLLVFGRFTRNGDERDPDAGHTLTLEIVDAARADVLATRALLIPGDRRDPVLAGPALVRSAVGALRELLAGARERLSQAGTQRVVAPLFFRNADASPRLDAFGPQLAAAFSEAAERRGTAGDDGPRVLRFSRAGDALEEAELSVLGLTETDPEAWLRVADLYVWGSYRELPAGSLPFAQTPVEVSLSLWDGASGSPRGITQTATVAELPALARRLADTVLDAARTVTAGVQPRTPLPTAREEVARNLLERSRQLTRTAESFGARQAAFLSTPEGRALRREQLTLLETACFFSPANREAQLDRMRCHWPGFPGTLARLPLRQQWQRANDLDAFVERFPDPASAGTRNGERPLAQSRVDASAELVGELNYGERDLRAGHPEFTDFILPADATEAFIQGWRKTLEERFAREVDAYVRLVPSPPHPPAVGTYEGKSGEWIYTARHDVRDAATAARVVETLWPRFAPYYQSRRGHDDSSYVLRDLEPDLKRIFGQLGQPERAMRLLGASSPSPTPGSTPQVPNVANSVSPGTPAPTTSRVTQTGNIRPASENDDGEFEAALARLPRLRPGCRAVPLAEIAPPLGAPQGFPDLPPRTCLIHALSVGRDDTLWISASLGPARLGKVAPGPSLWRFDPATEALENVSASRNFGPHSPVTSILDAGSGQLWLTLALDGIWRLDPNDSSTPQRFGVAEGLLTPNMDCAAPAPGGTAGGPRLFFAGSREGRPLVNVLDPTAGAWGKVDLGATPEAPAVRPARAPRNDWQLAVSRRWLLLFSVAGGGWVHDMESARTENLRASFPDIFPAPGEPVRPGSGFAPIPPGPNGFTGPGLGGQPQTVTGDAQGFWLASPRGLVRFDPATRRTQIWPAALPGGISALAQDGDWLWACFQGPPRRPGSGAVSPTSGIAAPARSFVAAFHKPSGQWRGVFELPWKAGCIGVTRKAIYVALESTSQPLVEVDKASLLLGP